MYQRIRRPKRAPFRANGRKRRTHEIASKRCNPPHSSTGESHLSNTQRTAQSTYGAASQTINRQAIFPVVRILHCIASVNPEGGGPIEGITRLGAIMPSFGASSEIVSLDDPADPWVAAHPMRVHAIGPSFLRYRYSGKFVPWMRAHAAEYDIIVVNGLWQYSSFGVWRALHNTEVPYVVFPHGMLGPWFKKKHPLKHIKKWLYWPWAEYRVLRDARATIFTCEEERLLARRSFWLYKCREAVISYGTADPGESNIGQKEEFYSRFPDLRHTPFLLYVGRLHPTKGCDVLIRAFAGAANSGLRLVMAGPDTQNWKRRLLALAAHVGIQEQVIWAGSLTGGAKWGAFRAADALIHPSHHENFGIVVAEALACGLPVLLSTKVNIWREVVADGAGLAGPDTVPGISNLLDEWLTVSAEQRALMRSCSRSSFVKRFEISGTARSLLSVLNTVVAASDL